MAWIRRRLNIRDKTRGPKQQVWVKSAQPPHSPTYLPTWPGSDFHRLFDSGFAPSALMPPSELVIACMTCFRRRHCRLSFFLSNWLSSEIRVGFCHYSRAFFALGAIYFAIFARRALVRSRTPMILCLSNARSGDLHFGTSFVALRALVREIIPNTIYTYMHTWPKSDFHRLFDSGFAPSALSLRLNYQCPRLDKHSHMFNILNLRFRCSSFYFTLMRNKLWCIMEEKRMSNRYIWSPTASSFKFVILSLLYIQRKE